MVAITGRGIVSSLGVGIEPTLHALQTGTTHVAPPVVLPTRHAHLPVGEVPLTNAELCSLLGIDCGAEVSRTVLLGGLALRQATKEANLTDARDITLAYGTTVAGMDITERHVGDLRRHSFGDYALHHDCGASGEDVARLSPVVGETITVSTACSSALNAIIVGMRLIESGTTDVVIAGGAEALTLFHLNGFNSLMILDSEPCQPLTPKRGGLNLGEGAGFVVLESERHARERGAHIYGYINGWGNACDAYHITATSEDGRGAQMAMREAMAMAGLSPEDVDYINAHGTGTPNNDKSEMSAINALFAPHVPPVTSTKRFTGHTTSASGGVEAIICLLCLEHQFIPSNSADTSAVVDVPLRNILCNAFGFGGNDSAIVISNQPHQRVARTETHTVRTLADITIESDTQLADLTQFLKPLEIRRLGKLTRGALLASLLALKESGIQRPDAIILGTHYGALSSTAILLEQIIEGDEQQPSPTHFTQSTHNTIAGELAIRLHCHGYNITYSQGMRSLELALQDARDLLARGRYKTVLVGCHDETTDLFRVMTDKTSRLGERPIACRAIVLTSERNI